MIRKNRNNEENQDHLRSQDNYSVKHSLEYTRRVNQNVESWYTSADNKAQILLTLNGVFLGFLASSFFSDMNKIEKINEYFGLETLGFLSFMVLGVAASMFAALMCLRSRLHASESMKFEKKSPTWFFADISKIETEKYVTMLSEVNEDVERDTMAVETSLLSTNVVAKHIWINRGFSFFISGLFFFLMAGTSCFIRLSYKMDNSYNLWPTILGAIVIIIGWSVYKILK
ncbi:proton/sodium-glutamate symport protein [Candidatus Scalindua japonica]|uniref:Proton/sodium-glutamate symport protein n=1 Tax=Candidatus Scalindua japonica TaxID=1284222 RepID=A0A286TW77_9BACT|nr:Pycsar system effector family protein [Candidatus Scalindua japonica]GAX60122.1 proton/sodium-glutamate symport protein [Candidatus Scalindua japonica]